MSRRSTLEFARVKSQEKHSKLESFFYSIAHDLLDVTNEFVVSFPRILKNRHDFHLNIINGKRAN
jgi:hypothetical protein